MTASPLVTLLTTRMTRSGGPLLGLLLQGKAYRPGPDDLAGIGGFSMMKGP
jgi:hypothetical protein